MNEKLASTEQALPLGLLDETIPGKVLVRASQWLFSLIEDVPDGTTIGFSKVGLVKLVEQLDMYESRIEHIEGYLAGSSGGQFVSLDKMLEQAEIEFPNYGIETEDTGNGSQTEE